MLTPQVLGAMLLDIESDRIERTSSTKDTDKFAQAVCGFANDLPQHRQPGYLVIGADNAGALTRTAVTDAVTDLLLQNLAALRSDGNIQPRA